jgi:carbonic anhydrase
LISIKSLYLKGGEANNEDILLQYPEPAKGWDYGICNSTNRQSPIEIPSIKDEFVKKGDGYAKIIDLVYQKINNVSVKYIHGHKWSTEDKNMGKITININGTSYDYELKSFHFHLYSEHRLESKQYPMEMHLVHQNDKDDKDADDPNKNLVLGVLFDYADDKENKFLKDINLATNETIKDASISDLIKKNDTFYFYKGSLTTEPCTENVNWIVFKDIKAMSYEQYKVFKNWVESSNPDYYGVGYGNARGPKPLNNRTIYLENEEGLESSKGNFLVITIVSFWIYLMFILY